MLAARIQVRSLRSLGYHNGVAALRFDGASRLFGRRTPRIRHSLQIVEMPHGTKRVDTRGLFGPHAFDTRAGCIVELDLRMRLEK